MLNWTNYNNEWLDKLMMMDQLMHIASKWIIASSVILFFLSCLSVSTLCFCLGVITFPRPCSLNTHLILYIMVFIFMYLLLCFSLLTSAGILETDITFLVIFSLVFFLSCYFACKYGPFHLILALFPCSSWRWSFILTLKGCECPFH